MKLIKLFACVLLLSVVLCQSGSDVVTYLETIDLPTTSLGNFEGSYTSNSKLGHSLNICQDEDEIYGSYDEYGILHGTVSDKKASGNFYQAGTSSCSHGTFEFLKTSSGFEGNFACAGVSGKTFWNETKLSPFRPTDLQCARMDLSDSDSIDGRYLDAFNQPNDICTDGEAATASYLYETSNGEVQNGYFEGISHSSGKILTGTWYSPVPSAGAVLYFLGVAGDVHAFFWTGLDGVDGDTVINPAEYRQSQYHYVASFSGPVSKSSSEACDDYSSVKTKVLNNLVADNDDDLYYFVTSDFNNVVDDDGGDDDGAVDDEDYSSDASHVYWSVFAILVMALLF